ncbi:hypothetical protein Ciccas_004048 [Cichlidogyrus casuarinus]|uniref:C2H2-type domain-containing protein n=1 Tax=Cichlidogyrus casuarinus TaxID=1844966 RepID=A0ABD2QCM8_9PLAT
MVGENGLLNSESLNALQHTGAISVYNTLQQNNWDYPTPEDGEMITIKRDNMAYDATEREDLKHAENPSIHLSDCFIEGEKAKLHGYAKEIPSYLPSCILFKSVVGDDQSEIESPLSPTLNVDNSLEVVNSGKGFAVKTNEKEIVPLEEYFYAITEPSSEYSEEKAEFRFKCAVCQRMFTSNVVLMYHIMEHVDENAIALLCFREEYGCMICQQDFSTARELRLHNDRIHPTYLGSNGESYSSRSAFENAENHSGEMVPLIRWGCNSPTVQFFCKICGKETASELALAHHLQFTHHYREQPYVCRLCMFRSSVYEDILEHFYQFHQNSNHLICPYCLRIFTPSNARPASWSPPQSSLSGGVSTAGLGAGVGQTQVLLQHLRLHQIAHHLRRCTCCKLTFTNRYDYLIHCRLDHGPCIPDMKKSLAEAQLERRHGITLISSQGSERPSKEQLIEEPPTGITLVDENGQQILVPPGHELAYIEGESEDQRTLVFFRQNQQQQYEERPRKASVAMLDKAEAQEVEVKSLVSSAGQKRSSQSILVEGERRFLLAPTETMVLGLPRRQISPLATCYATGQSKYPGLGRRRAETCGFSSPLSLDQDTWTGPSSKPLAGPKSVKQAREAQVKTNGKAALAQKARKKLACLECDAYLDDVNHRRRLPCSACCFNSCCAAAFNRHVERVHLSEHNRGKMTFSQEQLRSGSPFTRAVKFAWMKRVSGDTEEEQAAAYEKKLIPDVVHDPRKFHCLACGRGGMTGNRLARHLAEECLFSAATMAPSEELLLKASTMPVKNDSNELGSVVISEAVAGEVNNAVTALAVQTLGVLQPDQTVELTNDQGEVFQELTWPEGLQLDPGQIVVIIQGEDGSAQLAIVAQDTYDATTGQVLLPPEEESDEALQSDPVTNF